MKLPKVGPAFLVTAAFIGPGTVITASMAGANYGLTLIWALLFAMIATLVLQEMAARLGIITQQGLGENIRQAISQPFWRTLTILLVVSAIVIGNGAYQSGNISGASLGLASISEQLSLSIAYTNVVFPVLIGSVAFILLYTGSYKLIERALVVLVGLMSMAFLVSFFLTKPDWTGLISSMFAFELPTGAGLTVIALIGTTVVPYNLFLHAATASKKWQSSSDLTEARQDLFISIPLGGLISIAIVSTAASAFFGQQLQLQSAADLAPSLQPLFGDWASIFIAIGLFSAGISSAITAPLAAAFALSGILNWNKDLNALSFKMTWMTILVIGVVVASLGYKPIAIIWFAQVANGILLPVISVFLLWIMNSQVLGEYRNKLWQNIAGAAVIFIALMLSARSLLSAFGLL
ncbi:divalent metal cation transporter [Colwellia sp. M166]|uniref:Nramp family divalent metal transporter n=1 Tax=Colwellia sp. M166 TaxID=2583805 RepID=UPI00079B212E|nr:Nramp family divalent metal transporter [Colwellia sp. M166]KXJ52886.1 MAG: manganese transporter [Colwellia sp. Phe_37]UUO25304.1 divalent metal cation transporter [Colwellia sp. M166]|tara:strand:+ start:7217 stop:8437 length:1221 start_codon:yes stop_codon:yes gene_type:complete